MADTQPRQDEIFFEFFLELGFEIIAGRHAIFDQEFTPLQISTADEGVTVTRAIEHGVGVEESNAFQVPKTSMTHSLAVLERHCLIEMRPHRHDGRSKCVFITPAGRALRDAALAAIAHDIAELAARFSAPRLAETLPTLTALRKVMDAMRDPGGIGAD